MMIHDYHLHAQFSKDSDATIEDYCNYACKLGVPEIAVTEHLTLYEKDKNYTEFNYRSFINEIERCSLLFKGRVAVKAGIEIDYHPHLEEDLKELISEWDKLDFVIGSIHYVNGKSVINNCLDKTEVDSLISDYFLVMEELVSSGICDVIGHFDVFRRSMTEKFEVDRYLSVLKKVLYKIAECNMAIEVNTSGFHRGLNDIFPTGKVLKLFKDFGGKYITIGSDAHHVWELAREQTKAIAELRTAGFNQITCFKGRKPYLVSF